MTILKAYVHYDGNIPVTINSAVAVDGFNTLGIEVIPFQDIKETKPGKEVLVHGYIGDVRRALKSLGLPLPPNFDFPKELYYFYGRNIWSGRLKDVRYMKDNVFVKPVEQKLFTGFVWHGTKAERLSVAVYDDETPCYFSDPCEFVSEYRCFVLDKKILGVRHYKGDWSKAPDRGVVEEAVSLCNGPRAYAIDFGIIDSGATLVVECNDGFALGAYGLPCISYASMVEARWEELAESL